MPKGEAQREAGAKLQHDLEASIYSEDEGDQSEGCNWDMTRSDLRLRKSGHTERHSGDTSLGGENP